MTEDGKRTEQPDKLLEIVEKILTAMKKFQNKKAWG